MIKAVTVTNYLGSLDEHVQRALNQTDYEMSNTTAHILLNDQDPDHGFLITKITGLGPIKADINMTKLATADGSIYNSARFNERNIVITIRFSGVDIEAARQRTYKYFPTKRKVMLSIETDHRNARVIGYVESNEPNIFSDKEEANISIICPDPYFYSNEYGKSPNIITFSGLESKFEFPFENNSLSEKLIEFGIITPIAEKFILYDGDQETGVRMYINVTDSIDTNINIYQSKNSENPNDPEIQSHFLLDIAKFNALMDSNLVSGDSIVIDTTMGNKRITLKRGINEYNILNAVTRDSDWFQLAKGNNRFIYTAYGNESHMRFRIENYTIYEGV